MQTIEKTKTKKKRRRDAVPAHYLPVFERFDNFREVNLGYQKLEEVESEADRCISCRKPKCMEACPGHFNIKDMLTLMKEGKAENAADIVNAFYCTPSSFNRICPAFCQDACVLSKKGEPIQILNIKRYLADHYEKPKEFYQIQNDFTSKIAIIGSGPAGLTAAHGLAQLGYKVTVFEKYSTLGGMFAVGIPEYRLSYSLLMQEINDLESMGIEFKTGISYGEDITKNELFGLGYRAILLAIGAHKPKFMGIPGEEFEGNIHAIDFLRNVALGKNPMVGEKIIVVGGGDVAIDAVRVAIRLGKDASIIYRRSKEEMPASKEEIQETENEGIPIHFLTNPVEIVAKNGKVAFVKLVKMELGEPDESGRRRPVPIKGSEYFKEVDTVIQAISQCPNVDSIKNDGYDISGWDTFTVNEVTMKTNVDGVFAAGDAVSGPKTAIEAINQAKKTVISIHEYLSETYPEESYLITM